MKIFIKIVFFILLINLSLSAQSVAHITAIKGSVSVATLQGRVEAILGQELDPSDRVITGDNSLAQIIFNDETIISLGKNSDFLIQEYSYSKDADSSALLSLAKGAMRTITGFIGKVAPQKFKVATKTATIGIRGTNFTIVAGEEGDESVFCTYGGVEVDNDQENHFVSKNYILTKSPSGKVEKNIISSRMLDLNRNSFFGGDALKYSQAQDSSSLHRDTLLDNITQDISRIVNSQVAQMTKESTETY